MWYRLREVAAEATTELAKKIGHPNRFEYTDAIEPSLKSRLIAELLYVPEKVDSAVFWCC